MTDINIIMEQWGAWVRSGYSMAHLNAKCLIGQLMTNQGCLDGVPICYDDDLMMEVDRIVFRLKNSDKIKQQKQYHILMLNFVHGLPYNKAHVLVRVTTRKYSELLGLGVSFVNGALSLGVCYDKAA